MTTPPALTVASPKETAFVDAYFACGLNGTQAVRDLGYQQTDASLKVTASRLLSSANVQALIANRMRANTDAEDWDVTRWRTRTIALLDRIEATHPATAAKLLELLGRHVGAFADSLPSQQAAQAFAFLTAAMAGRLASPPADPPALPLAEQAASQLTEDAREQAREAEGEP